MRWSGRVACKWRAEKRVLGMEMMLTQISMMEVDDELEKRKNKA